MSPSSRFEPKEWRSGGLVADADEFCFGSEFGLRERSEDRSREQTGRTTMKLRRGARALGAGAIIIALAGAFASSAPTPTLAQQAGTTVTTPSGLKIIDTQVGT